MMFPRQMVQYTGFTDDKVQALCRGYGRDYEEAKNWYDGYNVSNIISPEQDYKEMRVTGLPSKAIRYAIYNPLSVVEYITTGKNMNYWNKTETYKALAEYIRRDYDGFKNTVALLMDGGRVKIDPST